MDLNKIKVLLEVVIAIMVYYVVPDVFLINYLMLLLLIVIGISRWQYAYDLNSWVFFGEIVITILFVGALEKIVSNSNFVTNSDVLKEVIFWVAIITKLIAIKPLRVRVSGLIRKT